MKDLHSSSAFSEESDKALKEDVVFNVVSTLSTTVTAAETSIPTKPLHRITSIERPVLAAAGLPPASSSFASASSDDDDSASVADKVTVLYGIRHGLSVSNEWMRREGNAWGSPAYNDEHNIPDAPLSETGIQQARALCQQLQSQQPEEQANGCTSTNNWLDKVQLIVVSPLTRCLQTYQHALEPIENLRDIPVLALPLLTERVYSISETGRPVSQLQVEFPHIDWSEFDTLPWTNVKDGWWYDPTMASPFAVPTTNAACKVKQQRNNVGTDEWRPTGQGQRYLAAGEPKPVFERRMAALHQWLVDRPERYILAVSHWGVLRHFTDGQELDNCQVCTMKVRKG